MVPNPAARMPFLKGSGSSGVGEPLRPPPRWPLCRGRSSVAQRSAPNQLADGVDDPFGPPRVGVGVAQFDQLATVDGLLGTQVLQHNTRIRRQPQPRGGFFGYRAVVMISTADGMSA